ncbi:MAG: hypothetical protein ACFCVA_09040 [Gammaproteobacteria bacterium]
MTDRKSGGDAMSTQSAGSTPPGYGNPAFNAGAGLAPMPPGFPFDTGGNEASQSNPDQDASASAQGGDAGTDNRVYGS